MSREHTSSLYEQKRLPTLQNRTYESEEEARLCLLGDIHLAEDLKTGLVSNRAFDHALMKYDEFYQNEQAHSAVFKEHLASIANLLIERFGVSKIVEVGCGKGFFMEMLDARGADVSGFDPTYEGNSPRVSRTFLEADTKLNANGVILRHVLEHVPDPVSFLEKIKDANGGRGLLYIEVPCFDWICEHRTWFDVFYEHVNYFRLTDFHRIFGRVVYSDRTFGGQYISVIVDLASWRKPVIDPENRVTFPEDFLSSLTSRAGAQTDRPVIWGAGSKGVIYSIFSERNGRPASAVIDINPAKQGRHLPVTGLLVQSPDYARNHLAPGSTICVMNSNYIEEVRDLTGNNFVYLSIDGSGHRQRR